MDALRKLDLAVVEEARVIRRPSAARRIGCAARQTRLHGSAGAGHLRFRAFSTVKYRPIAGLSSLQSSGIDTAAPGRARLE